jgi:hypothetical protein
MHAVCTQVAQSSTRGTSNESISYVIQNTAVTRYTLTVLAYFGHGHYNLQVRT